MTTRWKNFGLVITMVCAIVGCTTTPKYNDPLTSYSPNSGYRFKNIDPADNSDSLFVILTFSGGGTRASALSLGVLEKLASIEIEWEGRKCRLLDEVDLISSVSGGSFTAAYYGLFGDEVFDTYADTLYENNNGRVIRSAFKIPNMAKQASPLYSRTDTAAEKYHETMFREKTYGDLMEQNKRPFILINATDMGIGRQFSFSQDYFDLLYSDLSSYPVGYAVAASSAFPGAFSALLLKNYVQGDDFHLDPWYTSVLEEGESENSRYRDASFTASYLEPEKSYAHLSDGGISDNLGLLPIIQSQGLPDHPSGLGPVIKNAKEQKVVIIVVDAAKTLDDKLSSQKKTPGLFKLLSKAGSTPLDWFSIAQQSYMQLLADYIETSDGTGMEVYLETVNKARNERNEAPRNYYLVEVGFRRIADDEERTFFEQIPTKFTLPADSITRLRDVGGQILDDDPVFQSLLDEIEVE